MSRRDPAPSLIIPNPWGPVYRNRSGLAKRRLHQELARELGGIHSPPQPAPLRGRAECWLPPPLRGGLGWGVQPEPAVESRCSDLEARDRRGPDPESLGETEAESDSDRHRFAGPPAP